MKRYLITTEDERSWKMDSPVLFLGEWCCRYDRKHVWSKMDAVIAKPYGLDAGQKCRDIEYVQVLSDRILDELSDILNNLHQTQHGKRYWNIVIGRWLQRYVAALFHRYNALEQALKTYDISGTAVFNSKDFSLAPDDSLSFVLACNDTQWNHVLYSKIIAYQGGVKQDEIPVSLSSQGGFCYKYASQRVKSPSVSKKMSELWLTALSKLARDTDAFIMRSYLPFADEIRLQLSLGQIPQLWRSPLIDKVLPDSRLRAKLILNHGQYKGFERYVRWQLPEIFPVCYLEGYKDIVKLTEELLWPRRPKFIFTSNCFDMNEVFQIWTASKAEQGIPYFAGQHGSSYGVTTDNAKWPERVTADRFITWGWTDEHKNTVPAFVFTAPSAKLKRQDPAGGVLLVERHPSFRLGPSDDHHEFELYQDEQFRFVESLPADIRKELIVRLHPSSCHTGWCAEQRWKDRIPEIALENGAIPLDKLITQSRIVVHSYDSTGVLENLSMNVPTICFWISGLEHIVDSARPYYKLLRKTGILFYSPEQAAEMLARNWGDVDGWWKSKKVQDARSVFCRQYARQRAHPVKVLKDILLQGKSECCGRGGKAPK